MLTSDDWRRGRKFCRGDIYLAASRAQSVNADYRALLMARRHRCRIIIDGDESELVFNKAYARLDRQYWPKYLRLHSRYLDAVARRYQEMINAIAPYVSMRYTIAAKCRLMAASTIVTYVNEIFGMHQANGKCSSGPCIIIAASANNAEIISRWPITSRDETYADHAMRDAADVSCHFDVMLGLSCLTRDWASPALLQWRQYISHQRDGTVNTPPRLLRAMSKLHKADGFPWSEG